MCIVFPYYQVILQFSADTDGMPSKLNSILTLSTWRWYQIPQVKGSVLQDCLPLTSDANYKSQVTTCASDQLAIDQR